MNTAKNIQQSQAQLALYLDLIQKADKFAGDNSTLIQFSFPDSQDYATQLHNEFLKAFQPFRNHLVDYAAAALNDLCPDMAEETQHAFTALLDRAADKGLYTADIADELATMQADNARGSSDQTDSTTDTHI